MTKYTVRICSLCGLMLLLVIATGCAVVQPKHNLRIHPDLTKQLQDVDSVIIVTPVVIMEQVNFAGSNERMTEYEEKIKNELIEVAKTNLAQHGFNVVEYDLESAISEDEELAYSITQVREGFEEAKKTIYGRGLTDDDRANITAPVGSAVNIVAQKSGADAVLLIHYSGFKKSGGSVAKDATVGILVGFLTGQAPLALKQYSYVELAFIDGATGDVLWSNALNSSNVDVEPVEFAFKEFPQNIDTSVMAATKDARTPAEDDANVKGVRALLK